MYRTALVYDFDGTLSPGSMQEHTLLPEFGYDEQSGFWNEVKSLNKRIDGDEILTYMHLLAEKEPGLLTKERLIRHGASIPYFQGVETWFGRINTYALARKLDVEHYIISSGLEEMIEGSSIRKHFKHVFASRFSYVDGCAKWPAVAINYTGKTQYLFRINKGILNNWNDKAVNAWAPMNERPIPFERMIFIGDGDTDIPAMKMLKYQGGIPIAVYNPERFTGPDTSKVYKLIAEDRATYICPADYREGSQLEVTVKGVLGRIARSAGYRPGNDATL